MRVHDRYPIPVSDGVDPAGWTAGLRRFVDNRYRLFASGSFDSALRSAVTNLRKTNLPVGITVMHGNHAWIITGFTATADPAVTTRFTVTSLRVVGPLWGLQSRTYGYDMAPDRKLTPAQLKSFFTPWHYARIRMAWENRWVSVQPVAATLPSAPTPRAPVPAKVPAATPRPAVVATPRASAASTAGSEPAASSVPVPSAGPSAAGPSPVAGVVTGVVGHDGTPSADPPVTGLTPTPVSAPIDLSALLGVIVVGLAVVGGFALGSRRRPG
jgi:hypothetical protein